MRSTVCNCLKWHGHSHLDQGNKTIFFSNFVFFFGKNRMGEIFWSESRNPYLHPCDAAGSVGEPALVSPPTGSQRTCPKNGIKHVGKTADTTRCALWGSTIQGIPIRAAATVDNKTYNGRGEVTWPRRDGPAGGTARDEVVTPGGVLRVGVAFFWFFHTIVASTWMYTVGQENETVSITQKQTYENKTNLSSMSWTLRQSEKSAAAQCHF